MSQSQQKLLAAALVVVAGLVAVVSAAWLIGQTAAAHWRLPGYQARILELREKVRSDARVAQELQDQYDCQRAVTLADQSRERGLGWTLTISAAAFLLGAKWLTAVRRVGLVLPKQVVALHVAAGEQFSGGPASVGAAGCSDRPEVDPPPRVELGAVDEIVARVGRDGAATIAILQAILGHYRYLPDAALRRVCELTEIKPAQLAGVASFYPQFRRTPIGEHVVTVCHGTACHVAGATRITDELRRYLRLDSTQDTDAAGQFTIQQAPCLGCCTLAPVVQIDGVTHGHSRAETLPQWLQECRCDGRGKHARHYDRRQDTQTVLADAAGGNEVTEIRIGLGSCCVAGGSGQVYDALRAALAKRRVAAVVKCVGCIGMCHQTPFVEVRPFPPHHAPTLYSRVRPDQVESIVRRHFSSRSWARRLGGRLASAVKELHGGATLESSRPHVIEPRDPVLSEFLGPQKHIATEHCGTLDPLDFDEYRARAGFAALGHCLRELTPEQVIGQICQSGLRGRGGAGFPTAEKWAAVREAVGAPKYVICNGDEGDPGAFMDRMLMESYPFRIIEGLAIAAYAAGATEGIFYIRAEYPLAVERISAAIQRCEQAGLLGDRVLGTDTSLHVRVVQGAGAFVCGEETALIASLEGQRGMPHLRPPYPAQCGLHDRPTLVNNVETCAVVPWIIRNGPAAFAALGTPTSRGTKVFALTGKIRRGGLIEVPMGITIRQIIEEIGGGARIEETAAGPRPHTFKAVQIGGPSGGCIPASLADTPVDFEALTSVGAMMGSGGLVVLDDSDCMVDVARYFLSFTQGQSCGECGPCRIGTRRMLEILERLCEGRAEPDDLVKLEELAGMVRQASLCGLGKTAPNPVLTTLRYFREEYEAHVRGRCPAGRCKALVRYVVNDACTGCTLCAQYCPASAIALRPYERHEIDADKCTRCDVCRTKCPEAAIDVV